VQQGGEQHPVGPGELDLLPGQLGSPPGLVHPPSKLSKPLRKRPSNTGVGAGTAPAPLAWRRPCDENGRWSAPCICAVGPAPYPGERTADSAPTSREGHHDLCKPRQHPMPRGDR
jgi:hypothetical protein